MGKAKEIYNGWKNLIMKEEAIEKIASERLDICVTCEHHSKFHGSMRPDEHCVKCGCTLAAKARSLESKCPIAKWPKIEENGEQSKQEIRD